MGMDDVAVIIAGLALIGWINWYFFLAERRAAVATSGTDGRQEIAVTVLGGYDPAVIHVRAGTPVRLLFDRKETSSCSEEIVIPAFGIRKFLPAHQTTAVEFTPTEPGKYEFTCGMSMLRGTLAVDAAEGAS